MLGFWFLLILLIILVAALPWWPYSRAWGYAPGSILLALLVFWFILIWFGWIAVAWPWAAHVPPRPV